MPRGRGARGGFRGGRGGRGRGGRPLGNWGDAPIPVPAPAAADVFSPTYPGQGRGRPPREERVRAPVIEARAWKDDASTSTGGGSAAPTKARKYNRVQLRAIKRLLKDMAELKNTPIPFVHAEPIDDDLFHWHGNLRGPAQSPFEGGVFHIALRFPDSYPDEAPTVTLFNTIPHPFVMGDRVCLNMLDSERRGPYTGWSPAYSVQSVLLQLQSFLLDGLEASTIRPGYNVSFSQKQTSQWKEVFDARDHGGEGTLNPSDIRELMLEVGERKPSAAELALYYRMLNMPADQPIDFSTFLGILQRKREYRKVVEEANRFSCSTPRCKHSPQHPWPAFPSAADSDFVMRLPEAERIRAETVCFYSRKSFLEPERATLGVGLSAVRHFRTGKLFSVNSPLDVISINAFRKMKVHKSADNSTSFSHWMPLWICPEHGDRAMHLAERALGILCTGSHRTFRPEQALEVFPRLLSGLVLELQKGQLHKTVRTLRGYVSFHRMLIAFIAKYPQLLTQVEADLHRFATDPAASSKANLGVQADILPLLSVSSRTTFDEILPLYLAEADARNFVWVSKKLPALAKEEPDPKIDKTRPAQTFELCKASYQLLMLHHALVTEVIRPGGKATLDEIAKADDARFGQPSVEQLERLQQAYREIMKIGDYGAMFQRLHMKPPSEGELVARLLRAAKLSRERHYHGERVLNVQSPDQYQKAQLADFQSLEALVVSGKTGPQLIDDEPRWREMCSRRFGIRGDSAGEGMTWKARYLRLNIEDMLQKLNESPDFKRLYRTLDLSTALVKEIEHTVIPTTAISSKWHYLTALFSRLGGLERFTLKRGELPLGPVGCRSLAKGLKKNTSLKTLDLRYTQFTHENFETIVEGLLASARLETLNLEGNPLGGGVRCIADVLKARHTALTSLSVDGCSINADGARQLAQALYYNPSLKSLSCGKNPMGHGGIAAIMDKLAYSRSIERVDASCVERAGSAEDSKALSAALTRLFEVTTSLREINFYRTPICSVFTTEVLHALSMNRSITKLDLGKAGLDDSVCRGIGYALARNKNIRFLTLEDNTITSQGLVLLSEAIYDNEKDKKSRSEKLARKERLTFLEDEEELRPRGCVIESLSLAKNHLDLTTPEEEEAMFRLVSLTKTLVTLNLDSCHLGVSAGVPLGKALRGHPGLKTLTLSGNSLGEHGMKKLAAGLAENSALIELDVSHNNIGGRGAKYVGEFLSSQAIALRKLNMFGNLIGIEGARYVAEGLEKNHTVKTLDLGLNRIRVKGAMAIAGALEDRRADQTLRTLKLKLNFINDRSALAIASAISGAVLVPAAAGTSVSAAPAKVPVPAPVPAPVAATSAAATSAQKKMKKLCLAGNRISVGAFQKIIEAVAPTQLDVAEHLMVTSPERILKTVLCAPLPADIAEQQLRKLFYDASCGAIVSVSVHKIKVGKGKPKPAFAASKYAFVEFADADSVDVALDLGEQKKAMIGKNHIRVIQCRRKEQVHFH